jgi:penicillin-binding protein 2
MNIANRKYIIVLFILVIGVLYSLRLFYMQVIDDTWVLRAQEIAEKRKEILPPRAVIFDRNGLKIVSNKTYYNLMFIENNISRLDTIAFAKLLNWTPIQVRERFAEIKEGEGVYRNKSSGKEPIPF